MVLWFGIIKMRNNGKINYQNVFGIYFCCKLKGEEMFLRDIDVEQWLNNVKGVYVKFYSLNNSNNEDY